MAAKKKTTTKKTTAKSKKITLVYSPVGFTAEYMSFPLKAQVSKNVGGRITLVDVPLIEGLPMDFTFRKGDTFEVTPEQLEQLRAEKIVETEEEHKRRKAFIENLPDQYPDGLNAVEKAERQNQLITASVAQSKIYNDKLIIRD